jgi:cysteine dioxygenase
MREHAGETGEGDCPGAEDLLGWRLPQTRAEVASLEWLVTRLRSSRIDWRLLDRLVRFSASGYARYCLGRTEACELLLVCWLPGQASQVHDHGGSSGVSWVVRGELRETRYAWGGDRVLPCRVTGACEGDVLLEQPETIHRIDNASPEGAVSLHLYAPPMQGMTRYDARVAEHVVAGGALRPPRPPAAAGAARRRRPRAM